VRLSGPKKKQATGLIRDQTIMKSKSHLMRFGFTESELSALFNANNRTEMNSAAYEIEISDIVASLEYLEMAKISRLAIKKKPLSTSAA
jgi:hypothetical protein